MDKSASSGHVLVVIASTKLQSSAIIASLNQQSQVTKLDVYKAKVELWNKKTRLNVEFLKVLIFRNNTNDVQIFILNCC